MKQIFINLPVKNVDASRDFYTRLGFTLNPLFTFDDQKCMVWSDQIYVMLQNLEMFQKGTKKYIPDPKSNSLATFTLPVESLDRLNEMMDKGLQAGGREPSKTIDEGYMLARYLEDLDGHGWWIIFLDIEAFKKRQVNK